MANPATLAPVLLSAAEPMPHSLFALGGLALLGLVVLAAAAFGGARERAGAAAVALAAAASLTLDSGLGRPGVVTPLMAIDGALLAALIALSWRAPAGWPVAAAAFQATAVALHLFRLLSPREDPWVYLTTLGLTSDGVLLCLAWGVVRARRARRGLKS